MGLFGSKFSGQNALDFVLGGTGGLDRRRAIEAADQARVRQEAAYGNLSSAFAPQQGAAPMMAPQAQGTQDPSAPWGAGATGPAKTSWDQILPAIIQAQQAGIDTNPILKAYQTANPTKEFQGVNLGDGNFGSFDPTTGKISDLRTDPYAAKRAELLQAQIDAQRAYVPLRGAQGDYYQAKARQPYAPQRPRSSSGSKGGSSEAPPSGFVLD